MGGKCGAQNGSLVQSPYKTGPPETALGCERSSGSSSWTRAMMSSAPLHPQPFLPWAPQGAGISLQGDGGGGGRQLCKKAVYWEVPHALC